MQRSSRCILQSPPTGQYTELNVKIVLFHAIQFNIITQFSSIWPINRSLSGATTAGQSGPGSDGNEVVICIPQNSSITGTSPSDCLVSYPGKRYPAESITYSYYIYDLALLANTPAQAESLLQVASGIGLYVNWHKTKFMCFNKMLPSFH